jgi:DNA-binding transcriptional LysR family regulator
MDLNELLVFTRVVQAGSFTAAARQLEMPKSSVSRKVSELEDRIGVRLLQRTTRQLGLTDAGRIYFEHSARIVAQIEEADQAVNRMQATPRGLLRVTAPLSFAMLGPIVAEFLAQYPDVQLEMVCTDRSVDLIEEGFDLAIRAGKLEDSTLVSRNLGALKRVVVAAPSYCKLHGTPKTPADLAQHACITFSTGGTPNLWTLYDDADHPVNVRVTSRLVVNDFDMMGDAARAALGIAYMPEYVCAQDLAAGRLRHVLPRWRSAVAPVQALYPTARHLSPKVAAFLDLVRDRFSLKLPRRLGATAKPRASRKREATTRRTPP